MTQVNNSNSHTHYILNKPYGYLSQFISNDKKEQKKRFLGSLFNFALGTMPIGRLDEKSEGLLLLTTNSRISTYITTSSVEKEYYVQLDGEISNLALEEMKKGVEIGFSGKKYLTKPCKASKLKDKPIFPKRAKKIRDARHGPTSWVSITLTEGKFKQVRKMTAAVGFPTLRLIRVRIGNIKLGNLKTGEVKIIEGINL